MEYPQYRKYKGLETWFKIISDKEFIEIKQVGEKCVQHTVIAEQFPEMLRIQDMLQCLEDRWEVVDAEEVESKIKDC